LRTALQRHEFTVDYDFFLWKKGIFNMKKIMVLFGLVLLQANAFAAVTSYKDYLPSQNMKKVFLLDEKLGPKTSMVSNGTVTKLIKIFRYNTGLSSTASTLRVQTLFYSGTVLKAERMNYFDLNATSLSLNRQVETTYYGGGIEGYATKLFNPPVVPIYSFEAPEPDLTDASYEYRPIAHWHTKYSGNIERSDNQANPVFKGRFSNVQERVVDKQLSVAVPAGTFDCISIYKTMSQSSGRVLSEGCRATNVGFVRFSNLATTVKDVSMPLGDQFVLSSYTNL